MLLACAWKNRYPPTVKQQLQNIKYDEEPSNAIEVTGNFEKFTVPGRSYGTGTATLPMHAYRAARVLDFSTYLDGMFQIEFKGNLAERIIAFLSTKWADIETNYDLYMLPINLEYKRKGMNKCDLPNVTFVLIRLMFQRGIEFCIVDPIHSGTDESVRIVNLSASLRSLQNARVRCMVPQDCTVGKCPTDAMDIVFYQRGSGNPDAKTYEAIEHATGLKRENVMHVHLTAGKYDRGGRPQTCYSDFKPAVARILHQFAILDEFVKRSNKRSIHRIYIIMDAFSAYAAFTSIAIKGYGLEEITTLLCCFKGVYTPVAL